MAMTVEEQRAKWREAWRRKRAANPEKYRAIARKASNKLLSTPHGKTNNLIKHWYYDGIKRGWTNREKWPSRLGFNGWQLQEHLEAQFQPGMTWENYGKAWHVDHIKPLARFAYKSFDDPLFREAWSLGNLRPMWAHENYGQGRRVSMEVKNGRNSATGSRPEADPAGSVQTG